MLAVHNLSVWNGRTSICHGAELSVHAGEVIILIAPNGAGKTTMMQAIGGGFRSRLIGRVKGTCVADGINKAENPIAYRKKVLYVADEGAILNRRMTVYEHLVAAKSFWKNSCSLLDIVRKCRIEGFLWLKVDRLSQGMRQRASFAVALASEAPYLLLDEPTNGLDQSNVDLFWELIGERAAAGAGIVLSTHILTDIDNRYGRILYLQDGKVCQQISDDCQKGCKGVYRELYQQSGQERATGIPQAPNKEEVRP